MRWEDAADSPRPAATRSYRNVIANPALYGGFKPKRRYPRGPLSWRFKHGCRLFPANNMFEVTTCIAEPFLLLLLLFYSVTPIEREAETGRAAAGSGLRWRGRTDATLLPCCCDGGRPAVTSVWSRVLTRLGQSLCPIHIFSMMLLVWVHLPSISSSLSKSRFNSVAHEPSSILSTLRLE